MKVCPACGELKPRAAFHLATRARDGLQTWCKTCLSAYNVAWAKAHPDRVRAYAAAFSAAYHAANRVAISARKASWYAANREIRRAHSAAYRRANPDKVKTSGAKWAKANPAKCSIQKAKRRSTKPQATPAWADHAQIAVVYVKAQEWGMGVDHVVPLRSKIVCGLHVWENLQLLIKPENVRKGNSHWPDMPENIRSTTPCHTS